MRSKVLNYVIALTVGVGFCGVAWAQPKNRSKGTDVGDKTIEKQSEWENKVMGEDAAKKNEMKKIAEAKRLADEAAKHPQPVAAPKHKDPNKEGARAKQEAAIGLPIESESEPAKVAKKNNGPKKAEPSSSANDALGALVASSLAEDKASDTRAKAGGNRTKGGGARAKGKASAPASSLDQMFAAGK
jgi:hypothetical protein